MMPTPARLVRVAHIVTWSDRREAHERDVNARLEDLPGDALVTSVAHAANVADTPEGLTHQFSTLISYVRDEDQVEAEDTPE